MADHPVLERLSHVVPWLRCPVCTASPELAGRTLGCESRHYFDTARQGHLNLLLRAAPKNADTSGMLAARDRFLSIGWYKPLTWRVVIALAGACQALGVGVGTGHYIRASFDKIPEVIGLAVDVSPAICRRAAGRNPRLGSVVVDIWRRLPIAMGSLEAVLCVSASRNPTEFARVFFPGGRPVVVTPGRDHLVELYELLGLLGLNSEKLERLDSSVTGFDLADWQELTHPLNLPAEAVADFVAMGPDAFHTYKVSTAARTTAVFVTNTFRRLQIHVPNQEDGPTSRNL